MYLLMKTFVERLSEYTMNPYTWHIQEFKRPKTLSKENIIRIELVYLLQTTVENAQHAKP